MERRDPDNIDSRPFPGSLVNLRRSYGQIDFGCLELARRPAGRSRLPGPAHRHAGRELALEKRQQLVPDPVARDGEIPFVASSRKAQPAGRDVVAQLGPRACRCSGRMTRPARGRIAARPRGPRAANQAKQKRFRLVVVACAPRATAIGAESIRRALEEGVAQRCAPCLRSIGFPPRAATRRRRDPQMNGTPSAPTDSAQNASSASASAPRSR